MHILRLVEATDKSFYAKKLAQSQNKSWTFQVTVKTMHTSIKEPVPKDTIWEMEKVRRDNLLALLKATNYTLV